MTAEKLAQKGVASEELAEKLLRVLDSQRRLGGNAYPLPLERLAELTDPQASIQRITDAVRKSVFKAKAIVAKAALNKFAAKKWQASKTGRGQRTFGGVAGIVKNR